MIVNRYGRARRVEGSYQPGRIPQSHPDANRPTRRMPYEQLRELVVSLIEPDRLPGTVANEAAEATHEATEATHEATEAVNEFETRPTICLPGPRTSTIDQLIAALRHPEVARQPPPVPRRRTSRR
jgi:hypothetical protein